MSDLTQPSERARATARVVYLECLKANEDDEFPMTDADIDGFDEEWEPIAAAIDAETERCARIAEEIGGTYDCGCKPCYCEPQRVAHESACEAVAAEIRDETT